MLRNISLEEITDGRLYSSNDMVKVSCNDCIGCSKCCHVVENSIQLDPLDVYVLKKTLNMTFEELMREYIELNIVDGVVVPNIKMTSNGCPFLNSKGRCNIHDNRPGFCRLFPLGRYYTDDGFKYIIQIHECDKTPKTKVKVTKWLGISNIKAYEKFVLDWHNFQKFINSASQNEDANTVKNLNLLILSKMYASDFKAENIDKFYLEIESRMKLVKDALS